MWHVYIDWGRALTAMEFLTLAGISLDQVAGALIRASAHRDATLRRRVARSLACEHLYRGLPVPTKEETVAALQKLIEDADRGVRLDVIRGLKEAGQWAVPILELATDDADEQLRGQAAEALAKVRGRVR